MKPLSLSRPQTLVHAVTDRLRTAIINAELSLGEALSEEGLAAAFSVSRTPVREALSHLQLEGLIDIAPQRGTFVFTPNADDIQRLCDFRIMLESSVVPLAAEQDSARTLAGLERQLAVMEDAFAANDGLGYLRADHNLHQALYDNCGNRYLQSAYALISSKMAALRTHLSIYNRVDQQGSLAEHRRIVELFRAHDLAPLVPLLVVHIGRTRRNFIEGLEKGQFGPRQQPRQEYPFDLRAT